MLINPGCLYGARPAGVKVGKRHSPLQDRLSPGQGTAFHPMPHIEQLFAGDGSTAKVTTKPGTPARTMLTGSRNRHNQLQALGPRPSPQPGPLRSRGLAAPCRGAAAGSDDFECLLCVCGGRSWRPRHGHGVRYMPDRPDLCVAIGNVARIADGHNGGSRVSSDAPCKLQHVTGE